MKAMTSWMEAHQAITAAVITVIGWGVVFYFNNKQQKQLLKDSAKMKVYEELSALRQEVDNSYIALWGAVGFDLTLTQMKFSNADIIQLWFDYRSGLSTQSTSDFQTKFINFIERAETWVGLMPDLKTSKKILMSQFEKMRDDFWAFRSTLHTYEVSQWRDWTPKIKEQANKIIEEINKSTGYLDDFMGLVHNELVASIVGYERGERDVSHVNKPVNYSILTKKGVEERNHNPTK